MRKNGLIESVVESYLVLLAKKSEHTKQHRLLIGHRFKKRKRKRKEKKRKDERSNREEMKRRRKQEEAKKKRKRF